MKYTFHPNFCFKFQGSRPFRPKIAKIAKSGQKSQHATRSVIWPRIKKCHKMKYTFHPHFCSKFQGPRPFGPKIAKIAKSGRKKPARDQICYLASNQKMSLNEIYFSPPLLFQISRSQTGLTKINRCGLMLSFFLA